METIELIELNAKLLGAFINEKKDEVEKIKALTKELRSEEKFYPFKEEIDDVIISIEEGKEIEKEKLTKAIKIIKNILAKKSEVIKLIELTSRMPNPIKKEIKNLIKKGELSESVDLSLLSEKEIKKLFKLLNRIGISCELNEKKLVKENGKKWDEELIEIGDFKIWIEREKKEEAINILKELAEVGREVQVLNVERIVRNLSEDEEKRYIELQKRYVELLRSKEKLEID